MTYKKTEPCFKPASMAFLSHRYVDSSQFIPVLWSQETTLKIMSWPNRSRDQLLSSGRRLCKTLGDPQTRTEESLAGYDAPPRAMEEDTKDALNLYTIRTIRLRQVVYVFRTQFALGPLKPRQSYNYRIASSYTSISFVVFLFDVFRNHLALDIANQLAPRHAGIVWLYICLTLVYKRSVSKVGQLRCQLWSS